jgi:hypothetical protein
MRKKGGRRVPRTEKNVRENRSKATEVIRRSSKKKKDVEDSIYWDKPVKNYFKRYVFEESEDLIGEGEESEGEESEDEESEYKIVKNNRVLKTNKVVLGHEDEDHEKEIQSIGKNENDIIQIEKSIQELKVKFNKKKEKLRQNILKIKRINCEIPEEKFKKLRSSEEYKKQMRGNKEDIKQSILSMRRDLTSSDLTKLTKSELVTMVCQRAQL